MADTTKRTDSIGSVVIGEGADVYGNDGEQWGRVEAVGAKYLTITEGILGHKQSYLPIALVAAGNADRVELSVSVAEAKAQARDEEPADEPIFAHTEPVPIEQREAIALPEPEGAEVDHGEEPPIIKPAFTR